MSTSIIACLMSNKVHIVSHAHGFLSYHLGNTINIAGPRSRLALDKLLAVLRFLGLTAFAADCFGALCSLTPGLHNIRIHDSTLHRLGVNC